MKHFEGITTQLDNDVRPRSGAVGYELPPQELDAVHGGAPCFPHVCGGDPHTDPPLPNMLTFTKKFKLVINALNK